jgi:hypothetical protein
MWPAVALSAPLASPPPRHSRLAALRLAIHFQHPFRLGQICLSFSGVVFGISSFPLHVVLPACLSVRFRPVSNNCFNKIGGTGATAAYRWRRSKVNPPLVPAIYLEAAHIAHIM